MIAVSFERPWLTAHLPRAMRVLSWAPFGAGFRVAERIVWHEVRDAFLTETFDGETWLAQAMAAAGYGAEVGMLTSRDVTAHHLAQATVDGVGAACLATVGLSNSESVGRRLPARGAGYGTINIAIAVDAALCEVAQVELMSVAVEARTAAVMGAGMTLATGLATGTGTDCVALACDAGTGRYAGMHTATGEAVGACVRDAVAAGVAEWLAMREAAALG